MVVGGGSSTKTEQGEPGYPLKKSSHHGFENAISSDEEFASVFKKMLKLLQLVCR
jgi:hypothetical protein